MNIGVQKFISFINFDVLENILSPEGRYVVYPVGVQLRSLSIYWVRKGV